MSGILFFHMIAPHLGCPRDDWHWLSPATLWQMCGHVQLMIGICLSLATWRPTSGRVLQAREMTTSFTVTLRRWRFRKPSDFRSGTRKCSIRQSSNELSSTTRLSFNFLFIVYFFPFNFIYLVDCYWNLFPYLLSWGGYLAVCLHAWESLHWLRCFPSASERLKCTVVSSAVPYIISY